MTAPIRLGKRCIIRLRHHGCWASELSQWLFSQRPDIELVVYARSVSDDPLSYRAVAVLKSNEQKEIDPALHSAIVEFLIQHRIIRSVQPRLPRPSLYTAVFLIGTRDEESPAAIRAVLRHGGKIDEHIGMPVTNGVEHITFFAQTDNASAIVAEIQAEYAKQPKVYEVLGTDIEDEYIGGDYAFRNPYYLPTYILCSEEKRKGFIEAAKSGIEKIAEWIAKNASWLIPLLAKILEWLLKDGSSFIPPPQIVRFYI